MEQTRKIPFLYLKLIIFENSGDNLTLQKCNYLHLKMLMLKWNLNLVRCVLKLEEINTASRHHEIIGEGN